MNFQEELATYIGLYPDRLHKMAGDLQVDPGSIRRWSTGLHTEPHPIIQDKILNWIKENIHGHVQN